MKADYLDVTHYKHTGYQVTVGHGDNLNIYNHPTQASLYRVTRFLRRQFTNFLFSPAAIDMWWFADDNKEAIEE